MAEDENYDPDRKQLTPSRGPEIPSELKEEADSQPSAPKTPYAPPAGSVRELAGLGIEIVASIAGLGAVGWLLDRWIGSFPWLMMIGLILGIIGGLYNAVKKANRITNSSGYEYHYKRRKKSGRTSRSDDGVDE